MGSHFTSGLIATKWSAIEVLKSDANFTIKADVWSFGVVMWEIFSLGHLPFNDIPNTDLLEYLEKDEANRLPRPQGTPMDMHCIMRDCWKYQPCERPSFDTIFNRFSGRPVSEAVPRSPAPNLPPKLPSKQQVPSSEQRL